MKLGMFCIGEIKTGEVINHRLCTTAHSTGMTNLYDDMCCVVSIRPADCVLVNRLRRIAGESAAIYENGRISVQVNACDHANHSTNNIIRIDTAISNELAIPMHFRCTAVGDMQ